MARQAGAARVIVIDSAPARRARAERFGAHAVVDTGLLVPDALVARLRAIATGARVDVVVETSDVAASFLRGEIDRSSLDLELIRFGGGCIAVEILTAALARALSQPDRRSRHGTPGGRSIATGPLATARRTCASTAWRRKSSAPSRPACSRRGSAGTARTGRCEAGAGR
jgi:hypothetical protein